MTDHAVASVTDAWVSRSARIVSIKTEAVGVKTYCIEAESSSEDDAPPFEPGQFNMLYLPGIGEVAISISGAPETISPLEHTVRAAGSVTQALNRMPEGATLGIRGPFGSSWPLEQFYDHELILVAGGIGMAPLRPVIYDVIRHRDRYRSVTLLYGARSPAGLLYVDEFPTWRAEGVKVSTTVDRAMDDWSGNIGVVTLLLDRMPLPTPEQTVLLTCGPEVMMWYTIQSALRRGLLQESLWLSLERNMNCAIGLCGHCQFGPQIICRDGPVFRFDQVASFLRVDDL
jgi:NAD(P)H-flavin reductase